MEKQYVLHILSTSLWPLLFSTQSTCSISCCYLCPVCPAVPHFSTLSHKWHHFWKKVTKHTMCVLTFCTTLSETFLALRRIQQGIIVNVHRFSCNVPVIIPSHFSETWISQPLFERHSGIKFYENLSCRSQIVPHGQTHRHDKLISCSS
jgi:hypothetical protein